MNNDKMEETFERIAEQAAEFLDEFLSTMPDICDVIHKCLKECLNAIEDFHSKTNTPYKIREYVCTVNKIKYLPYMIRPCS